MSQRMVFLVAELLGGAIIITLIFGSWREANNSPRLLLLQAAKEHGYPHRPYSINVPPLALPKTKLKEWRERCELLGLETDMQLFHPFIHREAYNLRVNFDRSGYRITEISIDWGVEGRSWSFPYKLNEKETEILVHKAITMMAESRK